MQVTEEVKINAAVLFMDRTQEIEDIIIKLPDWTNPMPFTGFQRQFVF